MKPTCFAVATAVLSLILTFSSCSKIDWYWKDHGKSPFGSGVCDVQKIYSYEDGGGTRIEMEKTYNSAGRVKTIGFYTYSATVETTWHRFTLMYNDWERTVTIVDSASGTAVLKAMFSASGRLTRLKRLGDETSDFADRIFNYSGGRLVSINEHWRTFDNVEAFTYDANGNIKTRIKTSSGGVNEAAEFSFGASASGKKQLYIPNFNYLIVIDPSMVMVEYLQWVKDFSYKNLLTHIEYSTPLPSSDDYSDQDFDTDGKLRSYKNGDYLGGTKYLVWRCGKIK